VSSQVELEPLLEALRALPKSERRAAALLASDSFQRAVDLIGARSDEARHASSSTSTASRAWSEVARIRLRLRDGSCVTGSGACYQA